MVWREIGGKRSKRQDSEVGSVGRQPTGEAATLNLAQTTPHRVRGKQHDWRMCSCFLLRSSPRRQVRRVRRFGCLADGAHEGNQATAKILAHLFKAGCLKEPAKFACRTVVHGAFGES